MPLPPKTKSKKPTLKERYPLGEIPRDVVVAIGRQIIHRLAVGHANIGGDDFGDIFGNAVGGRHLLKPEGVADVVWNGCAWSLKTVQNQSPFNAKAVRLISGRNSPAFSFNIQNPLDNPEETGKAVLLVWNKRVGQARHDHDNLRVAVLLRCIERLEFVIFEEEIQPFTPANYNWRINKNKNLEGEETATGKHVFTWQPHGSQFTVIRSVPASAVGFKLRRPAVVAEKELLDAVGYSDDWITIVSSPE